MQWLAIILTVLFVAAKLVELITWSWWLVFLPTIIMGGIWLLFFVVAFMIAVIQSGDYRCQGIVDVDSLVVTRWLSTLIIIALNTLSMKQST